MLNSRLISVPSHSLYFSNIFTLFFFYFFADFFKAIFCVKKALKEASQTKIREVKLNFFVLFL